MTRAQIVPDEVYATQEEPAGFQGSEFRTKIDGSFGGYGIAQHRALVTTEAQQLLDSLQTSVVSVLYRGSTRALLFHVFRRANCPWTRQLRRRHAAP